MTTPMTIVSGLTCIGMTRSALHGRDEVLGALGLRRALVLLPAHEPRENPVALLDFLRDHVLADLALGLRPLDLVLLHLDGLDLGDVALASSHGPSLPCPRRPRCGARR